MTFFFIMSLAAKPVAGRAASNVDLLHRHENTLTWWEYVRSPDFWNRTFQNWQSEFLAVASMVVFTSIYVSEARPNRKSSALHTRLPHKMADAAATTET